LLRLYRICRNIYDPKEPAGAIRTAGRWHTLNQGVLYFCTSLAMCILELKANSVSFSAIREAYHYTSIEINPKTLKLKEVLQSFYKDNWTLNRELTQGYGSEWYNEGKFPLLKVFSAVLPVESNYILNTNHPAFSKIQFAEPMNIPLDSRVK
jgi:RES domain-containing protein